MLKRRQKAEGRMKNAELGKTWSLESWLMGLDAGTCANSGGTAKYSKAKGKSRLGRSLALPVGRGSCYAPFKLLSRCLRVKPHGRTSLVAPLREYSVAKS